MKTMPEQHETKLFAKVASLGAGLAKTSLGELTLLQAILDNAPAVVYLKDVQGRYVMINRRYEELFHLKRKDVWGKTDHDFFPKHLAEAFQANDRRVLEEQRALEFEEVAPLQSELRTYISVKFPLYDGNGVPRAVCGISTDITERKRMERALWESQERLALVIKGSNDGIWDWNLVTNEVYYSPRWKSMLGYEEQELENHFSAWEKLLHPDDRELARGHLQAYLSGRIPTYELEHRLRHKDGSYRWILARGVALRDAQGKPIRMAGSHVDLTERKANEEKLRRAYEDLERNGEVLGQTLKELKASHEELKQTQLDLIQAAKLESVGTLAAGVAHEVKNPLQTILMGLAFLSSNLPADNKVVTETLGRMRDAVKRANFIISELLQLSSATDLTLAEEDIHDLLERVLELMHYELNASVISVERHYHAQVRRVRVDRTKMEQVLINILLNAIQAMSHNGVLSVQTRSGRLGQEFPLGERPFDQFQPGDTLVVTEVRDTGSGIPEGIRSRIFDPFFTTKPVGIGTGLGLSVMKKIIDLHGGAVNIQNHPNGGAVVTLVLHGHDGGVS